MLLVRLKLNDLGVVEIWFGEDKITFFTFKFLGKILVGNF